MSRAAKLSVVVCAAVVATLAQRAFAADPDTKLIRQMQHDPVGLAIKHKANRLYAVNGDPWAVKYAVCPRRHPEIKGGWVCFVKVMNAKKHRPAGCAVIVVVHPRDPVLVQGRYVACGGKDMAA